MSFETFKTVGNFKLVGDEYLRLRGKSDGKWYCIKCNIPAETEHEKEECHRCSDWNGCGTDCTLSKIFQYPFG